MFIADVTHEEHIQINESSRKNLSANTKGLICQPRVLGG